MSASSVAELVRDLHRRAGHPFREVENQLLVLVELVAATPKATLRAAL